MRIATIGWSGTTSAAVVFESGLAPVRTLPGRESAVDALSVIGTPLTSDELVALERGESVPRASATLHAPIPHPPKNVLCVGKNYREHVAEGARAEGRTDFSVPEQPVWFTKPASALVGDGGNIIQDPEFTKALDYEGELAIVIGRGGKSIPADAVFDHIFGYTIVNDVTARDVQQAHLQWFRGKSADSYAPCGPWIVTADEIKEPEALDLTTRVNGEVRQHDNTRNLLFGIPLLVSNISQALTLQPGDIIATGTPSGVAWGMDTPRYLAAGDVVEVEVEGIGTLTNTVVPVP
ncbi:fumarylacetoacetate hydrolase family protein [Pseudonocardia sp. CA-142604]|uniref:fumarylacetoacetate hydrolase family protein n=1 Tax=Pseudonocardia sp. CA-142604 TaxID=3240024 RepID=UPI003D8EFDAC